MLNGNALGFALLALVAFLPPLKALAEDSAEVAIRSALARWTQDFNNRNAEKACSLFAQDLRYDFRGYPERDYRDICDRMQRSLGDASKTYSYDLDVREIIVSGDIAVVRLVWRLTVTLRKASVSSRSSPAWTCSARSRTAPGRSSATSPTRRRSVPPRRRRESQSMSFPRSEFCFQKTGGVP